MTTDQMRCALAELYPGPKWRLKCMQMPERQVVAIYKNLSEKGKLHKKEKKKEPGIKCAVQLSIFDFPEFGGKIPALIHPEYINYCNG